MKRLILAAAVAALTPYSLHAQPAPIKIGFLSTFSGPAGSIAEEAFDGFQLALRGMDGVMAGRRVEVVRADDQGKPDIGRQTAEKMVQLDHAQIVTGILFSNVMLAAAPAILESRTFVINSNAGPSQYAGKQCNPHFFSVGFQNDTSFESLGLYMEGIKAPDVYFLAPNYPAGRDMLTGFKRFYKGKIGTETFTSLAQLDYSAEIADIRARNPSTVAFFYPGGLTINFLKQYAQAGLKIPLYTGLGSVDPTTFAAIGDPADGVLVTANWSEYLKNPANEKFVADFEKIYHRVPSYYAAMSYDTVHLIASALNSIDGKVEDQARFQRALESVDFDSVRGFFKFNNNHFPIQSFYITSVKKTEDGKLTALLSGTIMEKLKDSYAAECKMHG